jgi:hypothetical protein
MRRFIPAVAALAGLLLAACDTPPSESPVPSGSASPPAASPSVSASAPASPTTPASATPTPEPTLSLDPPDATDERVVTVSVTPNISENAGTLVVTVTSAADARIDELVLRWPAALGSHLRLAPFAPSDERTRDGGPPLVQPWTKWVIGPGEEGEPEGTVSVGWGPLLPGATLEIPLVATRTAPGPIAFDLQVLAENDLLSSEGGTPAEVRVEVP